MPSELTDDQKAWWVRDDASVEDDRAHEKLRTVTKHIRNVQAYRKRSFLLHGAMYGGSPALGSSSDAYQRTTPKANTNLSLNVSRNVVDAVISKIASKAKPKLSYATDGGDYQAQHEAQLLEKGVDGVFYQTDAYDYFVAGFRDACVFGIGWTRVQEDEEVRKVDVCRRLPWEVFHDDGEAYYYQPRSLYTRTYEDKHVLAWRYREGDSEQGYKSQQILRCAGERDDDAEFGFQQASMRVSVEEAWHLPSGVGATDGRHVIGVANCTLVDEAWDPEDDGPWPYASVTWSPSIIGTDPRGRGACGQGIVELGSGIQVEVNRLVRQIQNGHHLITGHWMVDINSKVVVSHINNDLSTILKYTGKPPEYNAPAIIAPEVYEHLWNLVQRYYALAGVNEQTAAAQKPAGLDSGEAQRVYADQQTETLLEKGARYEAYVKQCGGLVTRAARRLAKGGAYEVRSLGKNKAYEKIDWGTLDEPEGYELTVQPTSTLPGTLAGKLATASDMQKLGEFDAADILEITGMQDMTTVTNRKMSSRLLVEKVVGEMLRDGTPYAPHSLLNLAEAVVIARDLCNDAELKGVEQDKLQLVRDFVVACQGLLTKQPDAPAQQAGPGGAILGPGAGPVATPMPGGPPPGGPPPGPPRGPPPGTPVQ